MLASWAHANTYVGAVHEGAHNMVHKPAEVRNNMGAIIHAN